MINVYMVENKIFKNKYFVQKYYLFYTIGSIQKESEWIIMDILVLKFVLSIMNR